MFKYSAKRFIQSLLTILVLVIVVFLLLRCLPTERFFTEEQIAKLSDAEKNDLLRAMGLLDHPLIQLKNFLTKLIFHFDLGKSMKLQKDVSVWKIIGSKFAISMKIGLVGLIVSLILGVLLGVGQARNKGGLVDGLGTIYTVFVNSVPALVSYSLILYVGAQVIGLPSLYRATDSRTLIMPIFCLSLSSIAGYALWTRRYMVDELNKDYIKLARAKGLSMKKIMIKHVLRNAFVPLAQYLPASFLLTIGGSLLVERFFSVPGMGSVMTDAINKYDVNVVQACVFLYGGLGTFGVFLGDILMMIIDPRISLAGKGGAR